MPLLMQGETLSDFLLRRGLYRRARFRARLALWRFGAAGVEREWRLLPLFADPARAAVDVGANYGAYAGELGRLCARVHCFEPHEALCAELRQRLPPSAQIHCAALSDHEGRMTLRVPVTKSGRQAVHQVHLSSLEATNHELEHADSVVSVDCRVARLDDVVQEPVGLIKIDVEGHEIAVLRGARRILEQDRPNLILESSRHLNPRSPQDVFEHLRELGYGGFFLFGGRIASLESFKLEQHQPLRATGRPGTPYAFNFVFLPN